MFTGCAFAIAGAMDQFIPGFVKQPGFEFPRRMAALVSDGLACIPGALMGTRYGRTASHAASC